MPNDLIVRLAVRPAPVDLPATLVAVAQNAAKSFKSPTRPPGIFLLLKGDRDYCVQAREPLPETVRAALKATRGRSVSVVFAGRSPVRRVLADVAGLDAAPATPAPSSAIDLTEGKEGCAPLWVLPDGTFSTQPGVSPQGLDARDAFVHAARWISGRRTSTFERLFPPSAFHPDLPERAERVTAAQGAKLLDQARGLLRAAAVGSDAAQRDSDGAAQARSAALTVLSHMIATVLRDGSWRALADSAAEEVFALIQAEGAHPTAHAALRGHAILLLQLRGPALNAAHRERAAALVRTLVRAAPPYAELKGPWRFAMCSTWDFHPGEMEVIVRTHGFKQVPTPADAPPAPDGGAYTVFEAPFKSLHGDPVLVFSRESKPTNENAEMASPYFIGTLINRHAQLGSYDMRASSVTVSQRGYKLMMNSQCAGLTTRFALSRMFPDADLYSSWDSTYFRNDGTGKVNASEGLDCFVAALMGMGRGETHAQLDARIRQVQWYHPQQSDPDFVQFVGPATPIIAARFSDVNHDAKGDYYDGFLDFKLQEIAQDVRNSSTPRDPGAKSSQISGGAARGLGWATGSMNRVTQYSELWQGLPGRAELLYSFQSAGFYSHREPPRDVPTGPIREDLGLLPALCRYTRDPASHGGLVVEVMFHAWLAHSAEELKRLLVAAEAMNRAFDLRYLPAEGPLGTLLARRGAVLLMLAGLLEFPADQNFLDGLWSMALQMLNLPDISRSVVRKCITDEDHDASNYYGSFRGLRQLLGTGGDDRGELGRTDPLAHERLASADPLIGRAKPLVIA